MQYKILLLAGAGALGTVARYTSHIVVQRVLGGLFPWPTLFINVMGCFLFGAFVAIAEERAGWHGDVRLVVLTGFMGAFTTFSTFAFETGALVRESQYALAAANLAAQNLLGILFIFLGLYLGKLL